MLQRLMTSLSAAVALIAFSAGMVAPTTSLAGPPAKSGNPQVTMVVEMPKGKTGTLVLELFPKTAPKTVAHFLELVNKKFYDGILFHRYVPNFVIQGGDPGSKKVKGDTIRDVDPAQTGLGVGGSGKSVPLETGMAHERGTLGLARSQDPNSGDSQFFFNLKDNHQLDEGYCVFGKIVKGLDVMDKLRQGDKIKSLRATGSGKGKKK